MNYCGYKITKTYVVRLRNVESKVLVHGYYLEFVAPAIVFLPQTPKWNPLELATQSLSIQILDPVHVAASKLFSAFSRPPRKGDKQDIVAVLDQGLVNFKEVMKIADAIFDFHSMDARSDRFGDVYSYIRDELMPNYGPAKLNYSGDDELG